MGRTRLFHFFFLGAFALLIYQAWILISPFLAPILGAALLTVILKPLHTGVMRAFPRSSRNFQAALAALLITLAIIIPLFIVGWLVFNEAQTIVPLIGRWQHALADFGQGDLESPLPFFEDIQKGIREVTGVGPREFRGVILQMAGGLFGQVNHVGKEVARNAALAFVGIVIMIFTLFFFLRDGESIWHRLIRLVPIRAVYKDEITTRFQSVFVGIVRGFGITSLIQTIFATTGYLLVGVPAGISLGLLTGLAAFIPIIGSGLIWLPVGVSLLYKGAMAKGIFLIVWEGITVAVLDNFIRPILVRGNSKIPLLLLFFGMMGGLLAYGLKGVLLGPLVIVLLMIFVEIYQDQYLRGELNSSESAAASSEHPHSTPSQKEPLAR